MSSVEAKTASLDAQLVEANEELSALLTEIGAVSDRLRGLRAHENGLRNRILTLEQQVGGPTISEEQKKWKEGKNGKKEKKNNSALYVFFFLSFILSLETMLCCFGTRRSACCTTWTWTARSRR
jgi:hypothetical protein